jgi:hypothetical protein
MKKFLIILGVILILILGAVVTYVLLYGAPKNVDEIFANLTEAPDEVFVGDETDTTIDVEDPTDTEGDSADARTRLYQLTTRPVAGATFIDGGVRYVERGTGHIYEVDLLGGAERIVSGTTVKRTIRATFSPSGDHVALVTESELGLETILGTLSRTSATDRGLTLTALPPGAEEAGFSANGEVLQFFVPTTNGGVGYAYIIATEETTELFSIPLSDVRVLWGTPTYLYTTPSAHAIGYVYRIAKGGLEYVTEGGKGLMAFRHASGTLVSTITNGDMETRDVVYGTLPILKLFTEKCTVKQPGSHIVFCASPLSSNITTTYPDDWYKGVADFSDVVLEVNSASSTVLALSKLEEESGRPIDVSMIGANAQGDMIYMANKYDGALWVSDLR